MIERISRQMARDYGMDPDQPTPQAQGERIGKTWQIIEPVVQDVWRATKRAVLTAWRES